MPYEFLSDFLSRLQDAGELVRISAAVDTGLEMAAITERVGNTADGGPALLFEKPRTGSIPVVTNLLGSRRRLCLALGVDSLDQLVDRMNRGLQPESANWLEALRLVPATAGMSKFAPRIIRTAVCQQVVRLGRDVNLWDLPIPRSWPDEANPVITAGQIVTQDPASSSLSLARFPVQVIGQQQLVPHWNRNHAGYHHWQAAVKANRQFPVAVALGGDPVSLLATATRIPGFTESLLFSGFLRGASLDLVKARSIELEVPAASEIVLEGYIDYAGDLAPAPPIASGCGHYLPGEPLPVIHITGMTHRANPVLPAIIPGAPPSEESWLGLALERLHLAYLQAIQPDIVDIHEPFSGANRNLLFVSLRKQHPLHARQVLNALWGSPLVGLSKTIVLVDAEVDIHREEDVWFAVGANANPRQDLIVSEGPTHMDDYSTEYRGIGPKLGIDATRKLPDETGHRASPRPLVMSEEILSRVRDRWAEFGLPGDV
jgi:4-hydroxy-3-polyprenylbenzoate decarboxylase